MKVALLPAIPSVQSVFATKSLKDLKKANFGDIFNISLPANKIYTKTLQINVWNLLEDREKCVVSRLRFTYYQFVSISFSNFRSLYLKKISLVNFKIINTFIFNFLITVFLCIKNLILYKDIENIFHSSSRMYI